MRKVFTYKGYRKDMKLVKRQISSEKWGIEKIREVVLMLQTTKYSATKFKRP